MMDGGRGVAIHVPWSSRSGTPRTWYAGRSGRRADCERVVDSEATPLRGVAHG
jgi:hypothetical protein